MAKIYNSEVTKELARTAGIQQNVDKVPTELAEKIVPTFETNPKALLRTNVVSNQFEDVPGTTIVYTTPLDKNFYLVAATFSFNADSLSDAGGIYLDCVPEGQGRRRIFQTTHVTGTSSDKNFSLNFPPLLLQKGTTIAMRYTSTTGSAKISSTILGYTEDNPNI